MTTTSVRSTARLQFHKDFTLDQAVALVPYLRHMGVSHLYASPLLKARPGSTHGYDIVDHDTINPELGGEAALLRLVAALRAAGMGLILDIVPNHMGVGGADNAWWLDVLEFGRASRFAEYFDVDWDPADPALKGRMLMPFLGAAYGECLAAGDLHLRFDGHDGRLFVEYGDNRFPIDPRSYRMILSHADASFAGLAREFQALRQVRGRRALAEQAATLRGRLLAQGGLEGALAAFGDDDPDHQRLHLLLEAQSYRLAWWRAASDEINWRRFFDVNSLAGMRVDQPEVFDAEHATVLRLYAEGLIDGVRVDHVDGLADPRGYCRKLRRRLEVAAAGRPDGLPREPAIVWVEKILAHGEHLPRDWLTDGTTGYDFMNDVAALFHDPSGEGPLTALWTSTTGRPGAYEDEAHPARRQILREALSSELWSTANALHRVARATLATRDYTLTAIRRALEEILVHFVAYRIYAGLAGISAVDAQVLARALAGARRTLRSADLPLLDHLQGWLSGDGLRQVPAGNRRTDWLRAMVKFQQLSAPTAAKSVEDTAFYRYGRLLSRNEVGSEPNQFALTAAGFHAVCQGRQRHYPRALLATATHDHKRGEDNRARLAVLSEVSSEWEAALSRWIRLNAPLKREVDGAPAPDLADEIMLYQTIIGAWPYGLAADDAAGMAAFIERLHAWQEKAMREGKRHSEWAKPNEEYEAASKGFLTAILDSGRAARLAQDMAGFVGRIAPAGALNGLGQTVLRMTTPGIPDLYQGDEFWDLSLVDPDNRRPVDYPSRMQALADAEPPAALLPAWSDGRVKQAIIARVLAARTRLASVFAAGSYVRLDADGPMADHVFAFARLHGDTGAVVLVSRLAASLLAATDAPCIDPAHWQETALVLPRRIAMRPLHDVLGSAAQSPAFGERIPISAMLTRLPVGMWELR